MLILEKLFCRSLEIMHLQTLERMLNTLTSLQKFTFTFFCFYVQRLNQLKFQIHFSMNQQIHSVLSSYHISLLNSIICLLHDLRLFVIVSRHGPILFPLKWCSHPHVVKTTINILDICLSYNDAHITRNSAQLTFSPGTKTVLAVSSHELRI